MPTKPPSYDKPAKSVRTGPTPNLGTKKPSAKKPLNGPVAEPLSAVEWQGGLEDGKLLLIDQTKLPLTITRRRITDLETLREAIVDLVVRGAPAIGIAGAYGIVLHLVPLALHQRGKTAEKLEKPIQQAIVRLISSRPTAVNLAWALRRLKDCFDRHMSHLTALEMCARLLMEAKRIHREDAECCSRIAEYGATLLPADGAVYTHCNTGSLATGGVGTALGAIIQAHRGGKKLQVFAGETRPLLQGARLTALELQRAGVPVTLCCDNAAAVLLSRGKIKAVIVGADRIAANGDTANKVGTLGLAILAKHFGIPFYVAAPYSTFDLSLKNGNQIEIEERGADEVRRPNGHQFAPAEIAVANPAFDVTPGTLISAIITERGVLRDPTTASIAKVLQQPATPF